MAENEGSFFYELRRRNVYRVGLAYIVASWLLLQVRAGRGFYLNVSCTIGALPTCTIPLFAFVFPMLKTRAHSKPR